jgi:hypothetical protein
MKQTWFQRSLKNPRFYSLKANFCWKKTGAFFIDMHPFYVYFEIENKYSPILKYIVTCRPMSRQRPKYEHSSMERALQEVFSMSSAPCPLLCNGLLNIFPQRQTCGIIRHLLLGNGKVNKLCQQYGLFAVGSVPRNYKRPQTGVQRSTTEPVVEREREWSECSAVREEGFDWRLLLSYYNWLWLREIVKEGVSKTNHSIQNPLLLVTEPRAWQFLRFNKICMYIFRWFVSVTWLCQFMVEINRVYYLR